MASQRHSHGILPSICCNYLESLVLIICQDQEYSAIRNLMESGYKNLLI